MTLFHLHNLSHMKKDFKPCGKLPLCLIFLFCLNQWKLGHRKIWMKHRERVDFGCQGVPVTCGLGEKSQHAEGERGFYMEIGEHSKVWSQLHNCRPWGNEPSCRSQCDTSGSDVSALSKGLGWKHWWRNTPGCLFCPGSDLASMPNNLSLCFSDMF